MFKPNQTMHVTIFYSSFSTTNTTRSLQPESSTTGARQEAHLSLGTRRMSVFFQWRLQKLHVVTFGITQCFL